MTFVHHEDNRLTQLLTDQALEGLTPEQELELESLLASEGVERDTTFATAAATLDLALLTARDLQQMPARVQRRLQRAGTRWAAATASVMQTSSVLDDPLPEVTRRAQRFIFGAGPWLAAAACLILALVAWWPNRWGGRDIVAAVDSDPARVVMPFSEWEGAELRGVIGEAVWCDHSQKGYIRFVNLRPNDPTKEQYQLWIIDERGMEQRISGGVFDIPEAGEAVVPIRPGIPVRNARAFAVTIEEPGGTWVSDMSRRVAIASKERDGSL